MKEVHIVNSSIIHWLPIITTGRVNITDTVEHRVKGVGWDEGFISDFNRSDGSYDNSKICTLSLLFEHHENYNKRKIVKSLKIFSENRFAMENRTGTDHSLYPSPLRIGVLKLKKSFFTDIPTKGDNEVYPKTSQTNMQNIGKFMSKDQPFNWLLTPELDNVTQNRIINENMWVLPLANKKEIVQIDNLNIDVPSDEDLVLFQHLDWSKVRTPRTHNNKYFGIAEFREDCIQYRTCVTYTLGKF